MIVYVQVRGYSLMAKLQPSKLIMRVRFPLPAFLLIIKCTHMKKVLPIILLAGMFAGPVYAEPADLAKVSAMAGDKSGTSLDVLSMAVYELVKAQPDKAVDVFQNVMSQRKSWSVTETYAVLRSVLLASPSLESAFVQGAAAYAGGAYDGATVNTQGFQLLSALYTMPQTQSVASAVVQGVVGSAVAGRSAGNGVSSEALEQYVPTAPAAPEYTVTPTPPPTSANN